MVYSKRVHFELQHDALRDRWFVTGTFVSARSALTRTGPAFHVNADARLRDAGAVVETVKIPHISGHRGMAVDEHRYMFPPGGDGRPVAALCALLNTELRDTVWRKPESAAGQKRARRAERLQRAARAEEDGEEAEAEQD